MAFNHRLFAGTILLWLTLGETFSPASGRPQGLSITYFDRAVAINTTQAKPVLVEYVGATGEPVYLEDIPVTTPDVPYYLLLSFAIDAHPNGTYANGVFSAYWTDTLVPESILAFKRKHPNVKVLASLSGWSLYISSNKSKTLAWYDPENQTEWIQNAYSSLSGLVQQYGLDGIDIDYENFPKNNTFSYCIGTVISLLKSNEVISIASIAPFSLTSKHYLKLYQEFGSVFDLVNYQFYTDRVPNAAAFVSIFNSTGQLWGFDKLSASFAINGPGVSGENFFLAVQRIQHFLWTGKKLLGPSLMIWCVEDGATQGYKFEKRAQSFLHNITVQTF